MALSEQLEAKFASQQSWSLRRQLGIPNNRRLWVCACMDERLSIDEALGIDSDGGDAHVFRNAGGLITDDAIRSAMLTCQFFGTEEIVIINHTECGMMSATGEQLAAALSAKGIDLDAVALDPSLPDLSIPRGSFAAWIRTFDDVDEICRQQVAHVRNHPLIPDHVRVSGWVWEVENRRLRPAGRRLSERVNTSAEMRKPHSPAPDLREPLAAGSRPEAATL